MAAPRSRALVAGIGILLLLVVIAIATREPRSEPGRAHARARARTPRAAQPQRGGPLDCARIRTDPVAASRQPDPRRFAEAYLCAWSRREADPMRKTTLSPSEVDSVLRHAVGPEAGSERRESIRRAVLVAYLHIAEQVQALLAGVIFSIDGVQPLPEELGPIFEESAGARLLLFRARAPGKDEEAVRTVLAKAGGAWRFVPGIADPTIGSKAQ